MDYIKIWDDVAENYEDNSYHGKNNNYPANKHRAKIILRFLSKLKKGKILDAGCGSGYIAREVSKQGWDCTAIDLSRKMLKYARQKAVKEKIKHDIIHCSVLDMNIFENKKFDVIMLNGVLPYIKDESRVYKECYRTLKDNGYLITSQYNLFFDLFTFDKYTIELISQKLINKVIVGKDIFNRYKAKLKKAITAPQQPKSEKTMKSENPLIYKEKLKRYSFNEKKQFYYNFHILPPSFTTSEQNNFRNKLEEKFYNKWQGLIFAKTFISVARKV